MKTYEKDILASCDELKNMPYSVPEGYFDSFKADMSKTFRPERKKGWTKAVPYLAAAASLTLLLTLGVTMRDSSEKDELTLEDYILFSDNLINTTEYDDPADEQIAEAGLRDEEIIECLIYMDVTPEMIELSK